MINRLLLIDDDELTSYLVKKLIGSVGDVKEVVIKENGLEGLEYLAELKAHKSKFPEVILVDIDMPVMNGFEFVEEYENQYHNNGHTRLIMITSSKRQLDFDKCLSYSSVLNCIYKPLTREKIAAILNNSFDYATMKQA